MQKETTEQFLERIGIKNPNQAQIGAAELHIKDLALILKGRLERNIAQTEEAIKIARQDLAENIKRLGKLSSNIDLYKRLIPKI